MEAKVILWPRISSKGDYILKFRISDGKALKFLPFDYFRVIPDISTKTRKSKSVEVKLNTDCLMWDVKRQVLIEVSKPRKPNEAKQAEYDRYVYAKGLIDAIETKYKNIIDQLIKEDRNVTIDQLVQLVENPVKIVTVYGYFRILIDRFTAANKLGQARIHKMTLASLKDFAPKEMRFHDIDLHWLKRYEDYLRRKEFKDQQGNTKRGLKDTTISIYFRTLRSVYNSAIGEEFAKQDDYPFGKKSDNKTFTVSKLDKPTPKRAITKEQLEAFEAVEGLTPEQETAREIALFSYYAAGINFNDICKLRWANFDGSHINYTRTKTHTPMKTYLLPYSKNVIQKLRLQTGIDQDNYIFPILNYHIHEKPQQIENRIHKVLGQTNKALKEIGKKVGIKENLSTYTFRHSFITHAANSDKVTPFELQTMVGHKDLATTMIYYKDSGQDKKDELMKKIMGL